MENVDNLWSLRGRGWVGCFAMTSLTNLPRVMFLPLMLSLYGFFTLLFCRGPCPNVDAPYLFLVRGSELGKQLDIN